MKHEIDLKKFQIRTDLMIETIDKNKISKTTQISNNTKVIEVSLDEEGSKLLNRPIGNYITIEFQDVTDIENAKEVEDVFSKELAIIMKQYDIKRGLVIGLGNKKSTPDSLGPIVIDEIVVTTHLLEFSNLDEGFNELCAFAPGVKGDTGIETVDMIKQIIGVIQPTYVIVVDALASLSIERVNKTIQMSDTGISPGSGIGNIRKEISYHTLNVPVISIGIPTVVDAVSIVSNTINYMQKQYSFHKNFSKKPLSKMVKASHVNYLKEDVEVNEADKKELLGLIGNLNEDETRRLIYEVLTPVGYNLMVTPKEIDFVIKKLSNILSNGINKTIHPKLKNTLNKML